jgi:catalase
VDALLRFSIGGGNPGVSDKSRSVRGLSMRLTGGGRLTTCC